MLILLNLFIILLKAGFLSKINQIDLSLKIYS